MDGVDWNGNATGERYWKKKKKRMREVCELGVDSRGGGRKYVKRNSRGKRGNNGRGGYLKCCAVGKVSNRLIIFFIARCDWRGKKKIKITCGFVIGWIGTLNIYSIFIPPVWLLINVFDALDDRNTFHFAQRLFWTSSCSNQFVQITIEQLDSKDKDHFKKKRKWAIKEGDKTAHWWMYHRFTITSTLISGWIVVLSPSSPPPPYLRCI